jgi:hypothetical protein
MYRLVFKTRSSGQNSFCVSNFFNGEVGDADYRSEASRDWRTVEAELEGIVTEAVMAEMEVLSRHYAGETEEKRYNPKIIQSTTSPRFLPNTP